MVEILNSSRVNEFTHLEFSCFDNFIQEKFCRSYEISIFSRFCKKIELNV